jgi:hypothetical protein
MFIEAARKIHGDKFSYDNSIYTNALSKIIITCQIHGDFEQTAVDHSVVGYGCFQCSLRGFNKEKPATLYYIKLLTPQGVFYKIGITNNTLKQRFARDNKTTKIIPIKIWKFTKGHDCYNQEQKLLSTHKKHRFKSDIPILLSKGDTELFKFDVLKLDVNIKKAH